jgi:XcyI restriction endonuclease
MAIRIPPPDLQIEFSVALAEIRRLYLQDALKDAIRNIDIPSLDQQLGKFVPSNALRTMAAHGLRAELVFPVPMLLKANPRLLGYYRLLYGFSQKVFYSPNTGMGPFKGMEMRGVIPTACADKIQSACRALIRCGCALLDGIGTTRINRDLLDDLTLLTIGPQLRGGANVKRGAVGIVKVFEAIHAIVKSATVSFTESQIIVRNAAGRTVFVEFAPDPDIVIREEMAPASFAEKIAIEIKAGEDFSNIHNRIGEAEKSHQKARARGS